MKAFDTIDIKILWRELRKIGYPRKLFAVVKAFHINMSASVATDGDVTEYFKVKVGVKQGYPMVPMILLACIFKTFSNPKSKSL